MDAQEYQLEGSAETILETASSWVQKDVDTGFVAICCDANCEGEDSADESHQPPATDRREARIAARRELECVLMHAGALRYRCEEE